MDVLGAVRMYVENEPSAWRTLVDLLCRNISDVASKVRDPSGDDNVEQLLFDLLFNDLLEPDFVARLAGATNLTAASIIAHRIWELIRITPIGDMTEEEDGWFYSFDRQSRYVDTYDESLGFSVLEPLDEVAVLNIVSESLNEVAFFLDDKPRAAEEDALTEIFHLDIVDSALYKALITHPELLHTLNWRTFELLLADILASFGYEVELQRGTKDGGVDLFAVKKADPLGQHRYLLQAKRWGNKVGVDPVQRLAFLHSHHRMTKSCLATTSSFTSGAWEWAKQYQWQLELRDFVGIHDWIINAASMRK